jgi:hypothetical protein
VTDIFVTIKVELLVFIVIGAALLVFFAARVFFLLSVGSVDFNVRHA